VIKEKTSKNEQYGKLEDTPDLRGNTLQVGKKKTTRTKRS